MECTFRSAQIFVKRDHEIGLHIQHLEIADRSGLLAMLIPLSGNRYNLESKIYGSAPRESVSSSCGPVDYHGVLWEPGKTSMNGFVGVPESIATN